MAIIRKGTSSASAPPSLSTAGNTTAVETVSKGSRAVRTHVHYAPLFVLAQDYDDTMRALRGALDPAEFARLSHEDAMTLTLFTSIASVLNDMVQRSDLIARASRSPDGTVETMSVESLEAWQATERALVNEGRAAPSRLTSRCCEPGSRRRRSSTRRRLPGSCSTSRRARSPARQRPSCRCC